MDENQDVQNRMHHLIAGAETVIHAIETTIKDTYTPKGFYDLFKMGFLPVPQLMYCREEFPEAVKWDTKLRNGGVDVYLDGNILSAKDRMNLIIGTM